MLASYDSPEILNVGDEKAVGIAELANLVGEAVGYYGPVEFDSARSDGTPRKLLDVTRLTELGWRPQIALAEGIRETYQWYVQHHSTARK
jgi:GDP-L-fucose synthase